MTIEDAINAWMATHNLKFIFEFKRFVGYFCGEKSPIGYTATLSNRMSLSYDEDGYIEITGSLSKKSYKAHIGDPHLFPILDRALDEEDKWIRDGHRAPE